MLGAPLPLAPEARWEPTELPLFSGEEHASPYDRRTTDEPVWRLYEVGPKGGPRLIYETSRQPYTPRLADNGTSIRMGMTTRAVMPKDDDEVWLRGLITVRREGTEAVLSPLAPEDRSYEVSPVEAAAGITPFVQVANWNSNGPIILTRESGEVVKLTGLGENTGFVGWTPDGQALVVWVTQDSDGSNSSLLVADRGLYLVPLQDGTVQRMATGVKGWGPWSPDGQKLPILSGGQLHWFDRGTNGTRQLTSGATYTQGFAGIEWSRDGAYLAIQGNLIDAANGQGVVRLVSPGNEFSSTLTADGRYFMVSEHPGIGDPTSSPELCPFSGGLHNRTRIYEVESGRSSVLLDCDRGYFHVGAELAPEDGTHRLLLRTFSCAQCDGARISISLLTLETADVVRLTPIGESNGYVVSPDRSRFALTGAKPKIVTADGTVLEEIQIPQGTSVYNVIWAADGVSYYYILGPKQLDLL